MVNPGVAHCFQTCMCLEANITYFKFLTCCLKIGKIARVWFVIFERNGTYMTEADRLSVDGFTHLSCWGRAKE